MRERLDNGGLGERLAKFVDRKCDTKDPQRSARDTRSSDRCTSIDLFGPLRNRITAKIRSQIVGPLLRVFHFGWSEITARNSRIFVGDRLTGPRRIRQHRIELSGGHEHAVSIPVGQRGSVVSRRRNARIDPSNRELWLRGPNIVRRYWHMGPDRQTSWTDDGWYRTRDVARQDADGFLFIEDRVDNILVLWNGENVSASAIEQRFCAIPYVDTAIVIGHQRPVLIALVTLNEEMICRWAERNGHRSSSKLVGGRSHFVTTATGN